MNEIKEGSIDLADQTIDLDDIETAYEDDLDKENSEQDPNAEGQKDDAMGGMAPTPGQNGAMGAM